MSEERILLIQLRQLGDILLTTPCIRAIKTQRPRSIVTFLSHRMGELILDGCPYLDEHFTYDKRDSFKDEWRLSKTIRDRKFDLVIDFMNNPRSALYTLRSGATARVSFRSARRFAYTKTIERSLKPDYIVRDKFRLLQAAGFSPQDERIILPWYEYHTRPLMKFWGDNPHFVERPVHVVMSPTHRRAPRRWPLKNYAQLADRLVEQWSAGIMWLYGPEEEGFIDEVMSYCRHETFKSPKTTFREMAALVSNMDLFIGNSNGPSHVAIAADICSLQLHGHTDARAWCPINRKHKAMQSPEFGEAEMPRIDLISVDDVWSKLVAMQPTIRAQAEARQKQGPNLNWQAHRQSHS